MSEVIFEDESLRNFLKKISSNLQAVKDAKKKFVALMSAIVFKDVINHFEQEEGSKGKWVDWSTAYRKHMEKTGKAGNKKLQFSGRLRQTFTPTSNRTSGEGITWFNNAKTAGGFPYAAAHDEGGKKLPKRDFMWASDKAVEQMADNTLKFILDEGL